MNKFKLLLTAGFTSILLFQCVQTTEKKEEYIDYPLLETMGYFQRFSQKLWLAGENENWELANFYTHELEEVAEHLIEGNIIHDDYNLSNLSEALLLPKIEMVEKALAAQDPLLFRENYELMVSGCNLCHQMTKHAFIEIITPTDSTVFNQRF